MTANPNRKPRATREEMIARTEAKLARLRAEAAGETFLDSDDGILKALKNRLRKTETQLSAARTTLYGKTLDNGATTTTIDQKIEGTIARLDSQRQTKANAENFEVSLPLDIERLSAAIAAIEAGETNVAFPADLTPLPGVNDPQSDEENEALYIARSES